MWAIAHLLLRPVAVAAQEGPGEGRGAGGEVPPCTAIVSHWSMASGCKIWLINVPQICSRGASVQPRELEVASGRRVSTVSTGSGCILCFQRWIWGFASRAVRKLLGTPVSASSPLLRAVGRNIAARSQIRLSPQVCFCNLRLDSARLPRATPTRKVCGWPAISPFLECRFPLPAQPPAKSCLNLQS